VEIEREPTAVRGEGAKRTKRGRHGVRDKEGSWAPISREMRVERMGEKRKKNGDGEQHSGGWT